MDIVIHCPSQAHKALRHNQQTGKYAVIPKILLISDSSAKGTFKIQCNDTGCRKIGNTRGWHEVVLEPGRPPKVTPLRMVDSSGRPRHFELTRMPVAVLEGTDE